MAGEVELTGMGAFLEPLDKPWAAGEAGRGWGGSAAEALAVSGAGLEASVGVFGVPAGLGD